MRRVLAGLTVATALIHPTVAAQTSGRIEIGGAYTRSQSTDPQETAERDGIAVVVRAGITMGRAGFEARYAAAQLERDAADRRDFADLALLAAAHPQPWLTLLAGPQSHALSDGVETRRWVFWTAVARFESPRFARRHAALFGEVWLGIGSVNETDGTQLARGMETGVTAWIPGAPFFARLAYRLDEGRLDDAGLRSTVESVAVGVGYGF